MLITTTEPPPRRPVIRRRYIELHEQPYTPAFIRQPVQDMLTLAWTNRFPGLQRQAPSELVVDVLERVLRGLSTGKRGAGTGDEGAGGMSVVDFCSGAGGPIQTIERIMNQRRTARSLPPLPFLLTDIHPHVSAWKTASLSSPTRSLHYVPTPVDATSSPRNLVDLGETARSQDGADGSRVVSTRRRGDRQGNGKVDGNGNGNEHFRTFFLAFHHFDEEMAVRVLKDAMLNSDGIGIFELQKFDIGSLSTITGLWPLSWIFTPTLRPTLLTLIFTYLIPIVPFILVLDGYVSAYRSREFEHASPSSLPRSSRSQAYITFSQIRYLAKIAHDQLVLDGLRPKGGEAWLWEQGSETHTWPGGKAYWVVGKRAA